MGDFYTSDVPRERPTHLHGGRDNHPAVVRKGDTDKKKKIKKTLAQAKIIFPQPPHPGSAAGVAMLMTPLNSRSTCEINSPCIQSVLMVKPLKHDAFIVKVLPVCYVNEWKAV